MNRPLFGIAALCAAILFAQGSHPGFAAEPGGHMHHQLEIAKSGPGHHAHGKAVMIPPGPNAPSVVLTVRKDPIGGWNAHIITKKFRFAPQNASSGHADGGGRAHLYVNDKKIARVYGAWFHIGRLPAGKPVVRVTLNANDHRSLVVGEKIVAASRIVDVVEHTH